MDKKKTPQEITKDILVVKKLASGKGTYYPNSAIFPGDAIILAKGYRDISEKNVKLKDLLRDIQPSLKYEAGLIEELQEKQNEKEK